MPPSHKRLPHFYEKKYSSEMLPKSIRARDGIRTRDPRLGKAMLYH